jgi:CheY-like chemotaxis protein
MAYFLLVDNTTISAMKLSRNNLRIVLVDDDEYDSELLRIALVEAGFTHSLTHFRNGAIALEYFKYTKATGSLVPHVILLDINMPLIDGVRALHRLREASSFRDLPVIILTGVDNPEKRRELAELGIFRFLKKLPNSANVISALDDFIGFYNNEVASSATQSDLAYLSRGKSPGLKGGPMSDEKRGRDKAKFNFHSRPRVHLR